MHAARSMLVFLIVLAQALVGAGLGPRALCRDRDGSLRIDSALSPCCCNRAAAVPCCVDEEGAAGCSDGEQGFRSTAACQCNCTPISAQPVISQIQRTSAQADQPQVGFAVAPVETWRIAWSAMRVPAQLNTGPPRFPELNHLDGVILRL